MDLGWLFITDNCLHTLRWLCWWRPIHWRALWYVLILFVYWYVYENNIFCFPDLIVRIRFCRISALVCFIAIGRVQHRVPFAATSNTGRFLGINISVWRHFPFFGCGIDVTCALVGWCKPISISSSRKKYRFIVYVVVQWYLTADVAEFLAILYSIHGFTFLPQFYICSLDTYSRTFFFAFTVAVNICLRAWI